MPVLPKAGNPGTPLDLHHLESLRLEVNEIDRAASAIATPRVLAPDQEIASLLRALTLVDLTTLSGDDTPATVQRLCETAKHPIPGELQKSLGAPAEFIRTAAVCVYHAMIPHALESLHGSGIPIAAVSGGFPAGLSPFSQRVAEIQASVEAGASEIDAVIMRAHVLLGDWQALYDEVREFRQAAETAHLKVILATGELRTLSNVAKASWVCMMAGADFIKTSTGKEVVNATLPAGLVMVRAIREYRSLTGCRVGFKPAGGIRSSRDALAWMQMVELELGREWRSPNLFRLGASSLLADIVARLEFLTEVLGSERIRTAR